MMQQAASRHRLHDYHVHSSFSCDSKASMESLCRAAIDAGIAELGLSDHFDLHPLDPCSGHLDLDGWWDEFRRCQEIFAGELTLRSGVEVSEPHRYPRQVEQLLKSFPWDYSLGSLHWVGDECVFDSSYFNSTQDEVYRRDFKELERMVDEGEFDILAHFDVVKRYGFEFYGPFHPESYEDLIRPILSRLAGRGLALEVNTSTLRRSIQRPSPDATVLGWFLEQGGTMVTLGSDAHTPEHVGFALKEMLNLVAKAGFQGLAGYEQRKNTVVDF